MTAASQPYEPPAALRGIPVIDADTHLTEPADLWTSRAPARFRDRVPHIELTPEAAGKDSPPVAADYQWVVEGVVLGQGGGGSVVNRDNVKVKGPAFINWPLTEVSPAASFAAPRLALMDELGIWAQVVYPNVVGFGGQRFGMISDLDLRYMCCAIWNDAMAELKHESGGRLNGMATLPWWDPARAASEIERSHGMGLRGVNITPDPQNFGLPDLADDSWEPMWEACEGLGMPVNFHIGASQTQFSWFGDAAWPSRSHEVRIALGSTVLYLANARVMGNLIYSGILDRHPGLKFVSVESGIGWIPFTLEALNHHAGENGVTHLSLTPAEYFQRQIYACFWFESPNLVADLARVGYDNCLFETDFPHPTCLYPDPLGSIGEALAHLEPEVLRKVLGGNAARVYNIALPELSVRP
jgi:predicted TIM-barrel fold metal-dependent hydrolase